jgi:hypothetical protein
VSRQPRSVPDQPEAEADVYGDIEFFDGIRTHRLSITVEDPSADVVLSRSGWVVQHPFRSSRESTEEERAAVGWTW